MGIPVVVPECRTAYSVTTYPQPIALAAQSTPVWGILAWRWKISSVPAGSAADVGSNVDFTGGVSEIQAPTFNADVAGRYIIDVQAQNAEGLSYTVSVSVVVETSDAASIAAAQSTANNALTNAATAQSTANSAVASVAILFEAGEPHGFPNLTDSTTSFTPATRTFTIAPTGASFDYYSNGTKYTKNAASTRQIPNTSGSHFIYFDGETLTSTTTDDERLYVGPWVYVANIYWNAVTGSAILVANERHGVSMAGGTHYYLHTTRGAVHGGGLALGNYTTAGDGSLDAHARCSIDDGIIEDEDLTFTIADGAPQTLTPVAQIPVLYLNGNPGVWVRDAATTFPIKAGAARPAYNLLNAGTWSQPDVTGNNRHVAYWLVSTNDATAPIMSIMGQREDVTIAQSRANNSYGDLALGSFPAKEFRALYRLIFQCSAAYGNAIKARLVDVTDMRAVSSMPTIYTATDHATLGNRTIPDSHPTEAIATNTSSLVRLLQATDLDAQLALDRLNPFISAVIVGNGGVQNTAHGLARIPISVVAFAVGSPAVYAQLVITPGAHDDTNCVFTVTTGWSYQIIAW